MKTNFLRSFFAWGGMVALTFNAFLPGFLAYAENIPGEETEAGVENTTPAADPQEPAADPQEPTTDPEEPTVDPQEPAADPEEPTADPQEPAADPQEPAADPQELAADTTLGVDILQSGIATESFESKKSEIIIKDISGTDVAKIGETGYATLELAWNAAQDGDVITLLQDCEGNGMVAPQGKFGTNGLTVDFDNHIYTISGMPVGSAGTETIGFQLLKNNKITFKNGIISGDTTDNPRGDNNNRYLLRMIQNYSDLTLDRMEINFKGAYYDLTTVSHANGELIIKDSVVNAPDFTWLGYAKSSEVGGAALSVGPFSSYPEADATVTGNSTINGDIKVDMDNDKTVKLSLEGGTFNGELIITEDTRNKTTNGKITVTKTEDFQQAAPEGYIWEKQTDGSYKLVPIANNVASIDGVLYETLTGAVSAATNGNIITLLTGITLSSPVDIDKEITLDLNGKTISASNNYTNKDYLIGVKRGANLTIDGNGTIDASNVMVAIKQTLKGEDATGTVAELTIKSGTIKGQTYGISGNGNRHDTKLLIIDGNIKCIAAGCTAIYIPQEGTTAIKGGSIEGDNTALEIRSGKLEIGGGTFVSNAASYSCNGNGNGTTTIGAAIAIAQHTTRKNIDVKITSGTFNGYKALSICNPQGNESPVPTINIEGGEFNGTDASIDNTALYNGNKIEKFISGGMFSKKVAESYCAEGYGPTDEEDGKYTVRKLHSLKYVVDGVDYKTGMLVSGAQITAPTNNPTKDICNSFVGWTSNVEGVITSSTMPDSDVTFTANWNYICSRSSGGGGSSRSSSEDMKEVVLGGEVEVNTGDKAEINTGDENKLPENTDGNNGNGNDSNYDPELVAAYEWAYKNGITTMDTIEKARLKDGITRAELAKMMVVFMSGVLQKEPVITGNAGYHDVSEKAQGDLAGYIELAYQYQIMGINADGKALQNFNPNGKVSRAEFATVLSRVLYGSKYNQSGANYYELHIQALSEAKILKDTNPAIKEFRGWILLMLYRSQNGESNNNSEENTNEVNVNTGDVAELTGTVAETTTGSVAEQLTGAVVDLTGAVAELTGVNAELTGVVAELTGASAELTGSNAELTGSVQEAGN